MAAKNPSVKQRRHPQQARANSTYDAILIAAAQILERHGEPAFTTNRIAERAGVSIGSLYQYFQNKQAILVALAEREETRLPSNERLTASAERQNESALRLGLRAYITLLPDHPAARAKALDEITKARGPNGVASEIDARCSKAGLYEGLSDTDRFVLSRAITGVVQSAVREQHVALSSRAFEDSLVRLVRAFLQSAGSTDLVSAT